MQGLFGPGGLGGLGGLGGFGGQGVPEIDPKMNDTAEKIYN